MVKKRGLRKCIGFTMVSLEHSLAMIHGRVLAERVNHVTANYARVTDRDLCDCISLAAFKLYICVTLSAGLSE